MLLQAINDAATVSIEKCVQFEVKWWFLIWKCNGNVCGKLKVPTILPWNGCYLYLM